MLIVIGSATAAPGSRDALIAAAQAVAAATRADRGCLAYSFAQDVENPDRILSIETWADQAALDAHMEHDHTREFLARAPALVTGQPVMAFHQVHDQPPGPERPQP
ncbi:putative quinol monooxygenase [Blastococcus atacamensis]|uniref:putative quinol monooxygenase n=1 Tax=Blastococcus atacamensis TaxID=2070508 RepID=UPI000CEBE1EB|nr:putative quinol monooxygenase [Blastococcus atacamensis]